MALSTKKSFDNVIKMGQFLVICIGVGGIFMTIGKEKEYIRASLEASANSTANINSELKELRLIVHDLVKAQIQSSAADSRHMDTINDLKQRVIVLEQQKTRG